jgi:fido (protein-threonine AMPylation protein)
MPIIKIYDLKNLCKIHRIIFEDIYDWAGQIRKGELLEADVEAFIGRYEK